MTGTLITQYNILQKLGEDGMSRCGSRLPAGMAGAKRVIATSSQPSQVYRMEQEGIPRSQASHVGTIMGSEAIPGGRYGL